MKLILILDSILKLKADKFGLVHKIWDTTEFIFKYKNIQSDSKNLTCVKIFLEPHNILVSK